MKEKTGWIKKAYHVKSKDDVHEVYAGWADTYEQDLNEEYGYVAPQVTIDIFARHFFDRSAAILDVGCGTGLAGVELKRHGFTIIDGTDLSSAMVDQAETKGIYRTLSVGDISAGLDIPDNHYGAVTCVGVFAMGHVGPSSLDELIRIIQPGGILAFSINELVFEKHDYQGKFDALEKSGVVHCKEISRTDYLKDAGVQGWVATLQVI